MRTLGVVAALFAVLLPASSVFAQNPYGEDCDPPCRSGYYCKDGDCVQKCNPPCPEGERCTDSGECVPKARVGPGPGPGTDPRLNVPIDPGWAKGASTLGYVSAGVILFGATVAGILYEEPGASIPIGIVTTLYGGIIIPVVHSGGASARGNSAVIGNPGLRMAGWIGYGFALTDAVIIIGLSFAEATIPPPVSISVGVLGGAASVMMALDAAQSHQQATDLMGRRASRVRMMPIVSAVSDERGGAIPTVGLAVFAF